MSHADFMNLVIAVLPMLLLIGVWWFFMMQMRGRGSYVDQQKRIGDALERIAIALEERR